MESISETIDNIVTKRKSISRYGDGEFMLMFAKDSIGFQEIDHDLAERLIQVFCSNEENHIVALPDVFGSLGHLVDSSQIFWMGVLIEYRGLIHKLIPPGRIYGNSFITRFYIAYKDKSCGDSIVEHFKLIWAHQDILIVEGELSRLGVNNDLFSNTRSIKRIVCPSKNAFKSYEDILHLVKQYVNGRLVLIALGPTATILAYDLALSGIWALDIGHIDVEYSWYQSKSQTKEGIIGKYVNESGNSIFSELPEEILGVYRASILGHVESN